MDRLSLHLAIQISQPGQQERFEFTLRAGEVIVIGRDPKADVVIRSSGVSRRHCHLALKNGFICAEDLGSTSGTFHYGQRLEGPQVVADGDHLSIGPATVGILELSGGSADVKAQGGLKGGATGRSASVALSAVTHARDEQETIRAGAPVTTHLTPVPASARPVRLIGDTFVIGSASTCDLVLPHVMISRRHARLRRHFDVWKIEDANSTNGTFVNGSRVDDAQALRLGDVIKVGPHVLVFDGDTLTERASARDGISIVAHELTKEVGGRGAARTRLLDAVSLAIRPGEFTGLLGPSGCGKSTLMDALNGRRPADSGGVYFNGDDLYETFDSYKSGIGYVPQDVIFHRALTVGDALRYTSRLRLPADTPRADIRANIARVTELVGLAERVNTPIRNLSGGQKKRVSLAIELISTPSVLFLDEVTSGLDMASEREVMDLLRDLATGGLSIICITHFVDSLDRCDKLACLMRGRLVFYGPPADFKTHFGVRSASEVYRLEKVRSPEAWQQAFEASKHFAPPVAPPAKPRGPGRGGPLFDVGRTVRQTALLTSRYTRLLLVDRTMPLALIGLAPLIAALLCVLTHPLGYDIAHPASLADLQHYRQTQSVLGFGAVLTVMFLAMFGSVQEVVKESRIYRHERSNNLLILPYMISKLLPLSVIGLVQAGLVVVVLRYGSRMDAGEWWRQLMTLSMTAWVGTITGLVISTAVPDAKQGDGVDDAGPALAVTLMNAVVIPQLLFAGALVKLEGVSWYIGRIGVTTYWGYQSLVGLIEPTLRDKLGLFAAAPNFDRVAAEQQLLTTPPGYAVCLGVLAGHWVLAFVIWMTLLRMKDGGIVRQVRRTMLRR